MKRWLCLLLLLCLSLTACAESRVSCFECAEETEQIVLVEYLGGTNCNVSLHEKSVDGWKQIMLTRGYVGKNGMGKTKAGDKKTPVGTYNLNTAFGIQPDPGTILPYTQVTKYHYWCGSSSSGYYNTFCDSRVNGRAVQDGDEHLIDYKGFYDYCLFIDYNAEGTPHKGSCIFLHCIGTRDYTGGCVAIPTAVMRELICRIREGAKIVLTEEPVRDFAE